MLFLIKSKKIVSTVFCKKVKKLFLGDFDQLKRVHFQNNFSRPYSRPKIYIWCELDHNSFSGLDLLCRR